MRRPTVLLVGPSGVVGHAIADRFARDPLWNLVSVSRRAARRGTAAAAGCHLVLDLLDGDAAADVLGKLRDVTHVVYAAYAHRPSMAAATEPNMRMLENTLAGLRAAGADVERVVLIGGGKSYGEHLGPYKTPAKESDPRILGPVFYNDQEDLLVEAAAADGFGWTVLRPDVVIGPSTGSAMNLLTSLALYAALSKEAGVPLRFPGTPGAWSALHQLTDSELLSSAVAWALTSPAADREIFNVTNGDQIRWEHLWADVAAVFEMPTAAPQPMSLTEQMADKEPAWRRLVATHGLRDLPYHDVASWAFTDAVFSTDYDMVQSTVKIRRAGFPDAVDSHDSVVAHLTRLRREGFVP